MSTTDERLMQQAADRPRPEFLDRHTWLAWLFLVLLPFVLQLPLWLTGRSLDPIWYVSNFTKSVPGVLSQPFIDPNIGYTTEALGHLSAWDWLHGIVPWWNPYTGVGMPLAGELQPGSFFLPFTLLLALPGGVLLQQICMQIIAGLAMYLLLRELARSRLAALMGGALFALSGSISWVPGPGSVYCSLPFLPLTLWGIERARKAGQGSVSILAIGSSIAWSILAGFPEPAYISGLLATAWGVFRLAGTEQRTVHRMVMLRRALTGFFLGLLAAAPPLIAFVDYVSQSDSFGVHKYGEISLPWAAFTAMIMPSAFGPIAYSYHSAPLGDIWGSIGGYTTVLICLLAIPGFRSHAKDRGLRLLLLVWVLLSWGKSFGVQPLTGALNYLPLLRNASYFRYSPPSWTLALIVLAAFGLDALLEERPRFLTAVVPVLLLIVFAVCVGWPGRSFWQRPRDAQPLMFILMSATVAWTAILLLVAGHAWKTLQGERRRTWLAVLVTADAAIVFMTPFLAAIHGHSIDLPAIQFLQQHLGLQRTYTTGPLEPNYGAYFQVAGINHNVLPVPRLWVDDVNRYVSPIKTDSGQSGVVFYSWEESRTIPPLHDGYAHLKELGVAYVLSFHGQGLRRVAPPFAASEETPHSVPLKEQIATKLHLLPARLRPAIAKPAEHHDDAMLAPGQALAMNATAPEPGDHVGAISQASVFLTRAVPSQNGSLAIELCAGQICREGRRDLTSGVDSGSFIVDLDAKLMAPEGTPLRLKVTHQGGTAPVYLQTAVSTGSDETPSAPDGTFPGWQLRWSLAYGDPPPGLTRVYADPTLDIWHVDAPAPYFEVAHGGPCQLRVAHREELTADCAAPATILRRELFMPGWSVRLDQRSSLPVQQQGIFQSAAVPSGLTRIQYRFVPPHMIIGWLLSAFGLAGLLSGLLLSLRKRVDTPT